MNKIKESELILNADGSVYHLNLIPSDIADTIITVGDPNRVKMVSNFFDSIEVKKEKREFFTHTGTYKGKRLTVTSTGIGTDNIDIVFNEMDALVNIDLKERVINPTHKKLTFIRIGTSGCLDGNIPVDSTLISTHGLGMDSLLNFYDYSASQEIESFIEELKNKNLFRQLGSPYFFAGCEKLINHFKEESIYSGITATCSGFYGPQGRQLRLTPKVTNFFEQLETIRFKENKITNFEMETAGIYGLAKLLGHDALSINLLIANRKTGQFSENPTKSMQKLIEWTLNKIID